MHAKRILLVDDNAAARETIREIIEENPEWKICGEGGTGQAAVKLTRRLRPDIVVLDYHMPRMNGVEAANRIARFAPETPIFLFTADSSPALSREARESGIRSVIRKSGGGYLQLLSSIEEASMTGGRRGSKGKKGGS